MMDTKESRLKVSCGIPEREWHGCLYLPQHIEPSLHAYTYILGPSIIIITITITITITAYQVSCLVQVLVKPSWLHLLLARTCKSRIGQLCKWPPMCVSSTPRGPLKQSDSSRTQSISLHPWLVQKRQMLTFLFAGQHNDEHPTSTMLPHTHAKASYLVATAHHLKKMAQTMTACTQALVPRRAPRMAWTQYEHQLRYAAEDPWLPHMSPLLFQRQPTPPMALTRCQNLR
mmetsp:Transcript_149753/g.260215  ORF Transcript_149753/g.260215 Transcript_149753/m.260215 type:complete len:230 (+) Transcript_149753:91-780(+)